MSVSVTYDELLARLAPLANGPSRHLVALAGPPGAGKSRIAQRLQAVLGDGAAILPMDGYHLDDAVLTARGDLPRKGAPHSFDLDGFALMLDRLRTEADRTVLVPVFDRQLEISRAAGREISPQARLVLVEGNYLLLNLPGWSALAARFDLTVMISAPPEVLRARLEARWRDLPTDAAQTKLEGNDLPNMRLVQQHSQPPDLILHNGQGAIRVPRR